MRKDIQGYLAKLNSNTYRNHLSLLNVYIRDYEKHHELAEGLRFSRVQYSPKSTPAMEDLKRFHVAIKDSKDRAMFLLYAASGLMRHEILGFRAADVDLERRILRPKRTGARAAMHTWMNFFNRDADGILQPL